MDDFVTKPVVPESFYATVSEWVRKSPRARAGAKVQAQKPGLEQGQELAQEFVPGRLTTPAPDSAPAAEPPPATPAHPLPMPTIEDDVLDPTTLDTLTRGNTTMRDQIVGVYASMMDKTLAELAQALADGHTAQLAALGHKAKSSAASLGAAGLSRRCHELEVSMRQPTPDLAQAQRLVAEIQALHPQVLERLRAL